MEKENRILKVFENFIGKESATPELWELYMQFCEKRRLEFPQESREARMLLKRVGEIFERAKSANKCSAGIFSQWIIFKMKLGDHKIALKTSKEATSTFPDSMDLWSLRVEISLKIGVSLEELKTLFQTCLAVVRNEFLVDIWLKYLDYCLSQGFSWKDVVKVYHLGIAKVATKDEHSAKLREEFLNKISHLDIEKMRDVYQITLMTPPITLSFFEKCVQREKSQTKPDIDRIRQIYDRALNDFGTTAEDTWLDYIMWETENKEFKRVSNLHWKAKKMLKDPTSFIKRHAMMNNSLLVN